MKYKNWEITYNPKPIPFSNFDYDVVHIDYDGPEDGRSFSAGSILQCYYEIDCLELEEEDANI